MDGKVECLRFLWVSGDLTYDNTHLYDISEALYRWRSEFNHNGGVNDLVIMAVL